MSHPSTRAPLSQVLAAIAEGAHSLAEVSARTGLGRDLVDAAADHLVRMGRLEAKALAVGCPASGCGACPAVSGDGCGAAGTRRGSGPTLVALGLPGPRPDRDPAPSRPT